MAVRVVEEMVVGVRVAAAMEEVMGAAETVAVAMAVVAMAAAAKAAARAAAVRVVGVVEVAVVVGSAAAGEVAAVVGEVQNQEGMAGRTAGLVLSVAVADQAARGAVEARAVAVTAVAVQAMVVKAAAAACRE